MTITNHTSVSNDSPQSIAQTPVPSSTSLIPDIGLSLVLELERKDGKFVLPNDEENNVSLLKPLVDEYQYFELPQTDGKVFVIRYHGKDTLVFKDKLSKEEVANAGVQARKAGYNISAVLGDADNTMTYMETIDPNVLRYKRRHPFFDSMMKSKLSVAALATILFNTSDKKKKLLAFLKRRKVRKSMGVHRDEEDEEEIKSIYGHSKYWNTFKQYLNKSTNHKMEEVIKEGVSEDVVKRNETVFDTAISKIDSIAQTLEKEFQVSKHLRGYLMKAAVAAVLKKI